MRAHLAAAALGVAALGLIVSPACAQGAAATPCVLDRCDNGPAKPGAAPAVAEPPARRSSSASGDFDFYVLALSWSPGFCSTGGAEKAPEQCAAGSKLGFVVHGLWPQYERGSPQNCGPGQFPTRAQIESVRDLYPDDGLARHEWRVHGTCSGKSPTDYFADVRQARKAVVVPQTLAAPATDQNLATLDIARSFIAANPGLRVDEMAVTCRSGVLEEVRICFTKDLRRFRGCPEVSRRGCRSRQVAIPPVH